MTQEEFIDKLRKQIEDGEKLFVRFGRLIPTTQDASYRLSLFGPYKHYDKSAETALTSDLYSWEKAANIILSSYWGQTHPQRVAMFKISDPRFWHDFKETGERLIRKNLDVLKSFVSGYFLVDNYDETPDIDDETDVLQVNQQYSRDVGHTYNINAVNANVGAGTISTGDITGNELTQYVSNETKEKLSHVINEITEKAKALNNQEILEYAQNAQQEIEKPQSNKKSIRIWLNAIGGVAAQLGNAVIQALVAQGIGMLF